MKRLPALALLLTGCATNEVAPRERSLEVIGNDYAFSVPDQLPAGPRTFYFANRGAVRHELNISRLRPGITTEQLLAAHRSGASLQDLRDRAVGVLFAGPGGKSIAGVRVDLKPGERYAIICIFRDSVNAKRHYEMGMYSELTVTGPLPKRVAPQPATDTIVATDYAFRYPPSVKPGKHVFYLRNEGKQRHELVFELMRDGVTFDSLMKVGAAGGDVEALIDGTSGLVHANAGETALGGLAMQMLPGREYAIACFFRDHDDAPEHFDLGMYGSIKVETSGADGD